MQNNARMTRPVQGDGRVTMKDAVGPDCLRAHLEWRFAVVSRFVAGDVA